MATETRNGAARADPPPANGHAPAAPPPAVPEFRPGQVYTIASLTEALGLRRGTLPRELRLGRLRHAKRAGRVMIRAEWVLAWIAGGEVVKRRGGEDDDG